MSTPSHSKELRKGRVSQAGQIYLVTTVTQGRSPVFARFDAARVLIDVMRQESTSGRAQTLAFVVMPDHLHWLLVLGEGAVLSAVVQAVKSVSAHRLGTKVWQRGFYDRAIRREEDVQAVARYVVANPVRAGLVARVGDYAHWDAVWV